MQQPFIPVGYKFKPTDEQLVGVFLRNRVANGAYTNPPTIYECDLYGTEEPWEVWAKYRPLYEGLFHGGAVDGIFDLYFFTKLKKNDPAHTRVLRRVGPSEGTWLGNNAGKKIQAKGTWIVIGSVKTFTYKNSKSEQSGKWIMHEYSLSNAGIVPNFDNDIVLCRLKMKYDASISITSASAGSNSRLDDDHVAQVINYNPVNHAEHTRVENVNGSMLTDNITAYGDRFGYIDEDWTTLPYLDV